MSIRFRNYISEAGITEDYHKVREFLAGLGYNEYTYARWDWMATHGYLDKSAVGKIGIWEDEGNIIGLASFDCKLGTAFCLSAKGYENLKKDMLLYAYENLSAGENFFVVIQDSDVDFQDIAASLGFIATDDKESDAIFYIDKTSLEYKLPEGFHITTMKDTFDLYQYHRVLWKGFNHELNGQGELVFNKEREQSAYEEMIRPNVDLNLKVAVVAPDGNFVAYCGMWYEPKAGFAVIEPVATDPDYRKLGLGKAAVLEGIRRASLLGAKKAIVGSKQQFYYSIGLRPYATSTLWTRKR